ncbi:NADH-cytochrome b5 reductase-like [Musca autumnalis]|uniref:NADH-cytochrome b5 reductase-like n=1 Tax=Musca autumnalis TaxID=221902 RepID=UPI003CF8D10A
MADIEDITENDCCGNGCANCVLDVQVKTKKICDKTGKTNILLQYTPFRLFQNKPHSTYNDNVWEFHFKSVCAESVETPNEAVSNYILDMNPGYHLMLRAPQRQQQENEENFENYVEFKMKRYLLRPYSPYWWDLQKMEFKILVNLKCNGPMSDILRNLQIDNEMEFRGPIGKFEYTADNKGDNILMIINQGVAVAPALPIIKCIIQNEEDLTRIVHLSCFENVENIYFRQEIYDFQKFWNYKAHIYLAHEVCEECAKSSSLCSPDCKNFKRKLKYKESIHPVRLDENELEKIINTLKNELPHMQVVLAGTRKFQQYFKNMLSGELFGIKDNNIYLL